jgi:hypothetical protein
MNSEIIETIAEGKMTYRCNRDIDINKLKTDLYKLGYTITYSEDATDNAYIIITFIGNF